MEDIFQGYKGRALEVLKKYNVKVWKKATIETSRGEFMGTVLPRAENDDDTHIVLKIDTGYNIGIELMQIFVLVLTIPWIVILSKNNHFRWIRIIGAILDIIISVAWMTERYTMKSNIVSSTIETASNQGKWLVLMLFLFAMVSAFRVRSERERRYPSNNEHDDHIG